MPDPTERLDLEEGRRLRNAAEMWGRGTNAPRSAHYPWTHWLDENADRLLAAPEREGRQALELRRVAELIDALPHGPLCAVVGGYRDLPCDCWKRPALASIEAALHPTEEPEA